MHNLCLIYVLRSCDYSSNVPSYVKTRDPSAVAHSQPKRSVDRSRWGSSSIGLHGDIAQNDATQFKRMEDENTVSPSATEVEDTRVTFVVCLNPPHHPLLPEPPDEAMNNLCCANT